MKIENARSGVILALVAILLCGSPFLAISAQAYSGKNLLSLATTPSVVKTVTVGKGPIGVVYDPSNTNLYVTNNASGTVSVIGSSGLNLNKVIATTTVGKNPESIAYSSKTNEIYVANYVSGTVSVISGTAVASTITVMPHPLGVENDTASGDVYVENATTFSTVTFKCVPNAIDAITSSNTVTKISLPAGVGTSPGGFYDPASKELYAGTSPECLGAPDEVIMLTSTNTVKTLKLGGTGYPLIMAYDPANKEMFVGNESDIVAISSTNTIAKVIKASGPFLATYNPSNKEMYFDKIGSSVITVISSSNTVAANLTKTGSAFLFGRYDPSNHDIYYSDIETNSTQILTSSNTFGTPVKDKLYTPTLGLYSSHDTDMFVLSEPKDNSSTTVGNVQVISSGGTPAWVATLKVGKLPIGAIYDPTSLDVYILNSDSNTVSVISG